MTVGSIVAISAGGNVWAVAMIPEDLPMPELPAAVISQRPIHCRGAGHSETETSPNASTAALMGEPGLDS